MDFRRLRLSGFKSFVDRAELHIEPGLTGVVGPNGCGKSNLLEAIRWVMGEGSAKSLRGGGMEDVIFAGTDQRPARAFAEVTLVLDNAQHTATPPFDTDPTLEVTRRIERGLGSAYRVNGRDVRAKDVQLLFADAATGAHSPALVSQGRISAVIAAKPAERRALLEEASGISGLHVRRKDAEQKLRAADANLIRLDDVLNGMEAQASTLRRQARAAERYRAVSDRIRLAEAKLLFARWRDADAAERAARAEADAAEANVARAAEIQRKASIAQAEGAKALHLARTAEQQAQADLARLAQTADTLAAERAALDRRIAELSVAASNLSRDRAREAALEQDAAAALERLDAERTLLSGRLDVSRAALEPAAERVAACETAMVEAERALAEAMTVEAAARADVRIAEAARQSAQQILARARIDRDTVHREAELLAADNGEGARRDAAEQALQAANAAREAAEAAIAGADMARDTAAQRRDAAMASLATARANLSALEIERAAVARMAAVPAEASAKASGQVSADPGYERALAAALGDDLDAGLGSESGGSRRWLGAAAGAGDPTLPAGIEPLAAHVRAPAELTRRLAQVGVADNDDGGVTLAVGQRLVTRDGVLRRWDGFVATDVGRATAERLAQANRLALIEASLPPLHAAVAEAETDAARAAEAVQQARAAETTARQQLAEADRAQRQARQTIDAATAAIERLAARRAAVEQQRARAYQNFAAAEAQATAAATAFAALPPLDDIVEASANHRRAADAARNTLAVARADQAAQVRALESDSARVASIDQERESWRNRAANAGTQAAELARRAEALEEERAILADAPARLTARAAALESEARDARQALTNAGAALAETEAGARESDRLLAAAGEAQAQAREARAGAAARAENYEQRRIELGRLSGERFGCPAPVLPERVGFAATELGMTDGIASELDRLTAERERIGPVNLVAEEELAQLEQSHATSVAERAELTDAIARLRGSIGALNREGRARLLAAFEAVDQHFRSLFTTLFQGGAAHLSLIDSDDPLEAGLEIMAQPPGKKLQSLTLLSGGEQALTAVALIFALFLTNPAPICVLDEVDAPLDDANVDRFCDLLDRMSADTDTRFLIVTHNAVTMSRMHRLFGVTMVERGVSRLVSVDLRAAETLLAAE